MKIKKSNSIYSSIVLLCLVISTLLCWHKRSISKEILTIHKITPFSNPYNDKTGAEKADSFNMKLLRNECGYMFFLIQNNDNRFLKNVSVDIKAVQASKDNSSCYTISLYIVNPWFQLTEPSFLDKKHLSHTFIPELLLKDDREILKPGIWAGKHYAPPIISSAFQTNIAPSKYKMICMIVSPGKTYAVKSTQYILNIKEGKIILKKIPLTVTTINYSLPDHNKIKSIYYFPTLAKKSSVHVSATKMKEQFQTIKKYRFNSVTFFEDNPINLKKMLYLANSSGLQSPFVINVAKKNITRERLNQIKVVFSKQKYYLYGVDEPYTEQRLNNHIVKSKKIHSLEHLVHTAIKIEDELKLRKLGEKLGWANFHMRHVSARKFANHKALKGQIRTYYWQCYMEIPALNRLYSGFFFYHSKLEGILPFTYQLTWKYAMPYVSDIRQHEYSTVREKYPMKVYKNFFTVYPAQGREISTLQWEAFRRGDDDLKLCFLFDTIIKRIEKINTEKAYSLRKTFNKKLDEICGPYNPNLLLKYLQYENNLNRKIENLRLWILKKLEENNI